MTRVYSALKVVISLIAILLIFRLEKGQENQTKPVEKPTERFMQGVWVSSNIQPTSENLICYKGTEFYSCRYNMNERKFETFERPDFWMIEN